MLEPLKKTHLVDLQFDCYGLATFTNWLLGPGSPFTVSHIAKLDICAGGDGEVINPLLHAIGGSLKLCRLHALGNGFRGELTYTPPYSRRICCLTRDVGSSAYTQTRMEL